MKRLISLFLCITLFSPLLLISVSAEQAITKDEAVHLIEHLNVINEFKGSGTLPFASDEFVPNESAEEILERAGYGENKPYLLYPIEGFKTVDGWREYFSEFTVQDFFDKIDFFGNCLIEDNGNVYIIEGGGVAPYYPTYNSKKIEDCIRIVDNDTVAFLAKYEWENEYEKMIDFEYTENGWRISGGDATKAFLKFSWKNPETGDGVTVIIACLAVSMLGVGLTVKKRRYTNIA